MDHNHFDHHDGHGKAFGIVRARFNEEITQGLLDGALKVLKEAGVKADDVIIMDVPGSFEIIHGANMMAQSSEFSAIICLGAIIKGDTRHDEFLSQAVYQGMKDITLKHNKPVVAAVLTVENLEQAKVRAAEGPMNRGAEAAHVALEMAALGV